MAEQSKFSGALAKLNQRPAEHGDDPQLEEPPASMAPIEAGPKMGRPPGKRSDPDFQQTTLILRKETKKKANRKLEDTEAKMDLSDLVEHLLTEWTTLQT